MHSDRNPRPTLEELMSNPVDSLDTPIGLETATKTLLRPFSSTEVKQKPGSGSRPAQDYVEANTIIDRLNEAFTTFGWSFDPGQTLVGTGPSDIAVYGRLTIFTPWGSIEKGQWGSTGAGSMEYGDKFKSAASDALKKCAQMLGVFNYGWRKGASPVPKENEAIATELKNLAEAKGLSKEQFLELCSGVVRKTILGAGDLSYTQMLVIKAVLAGHFAKTKAATSAV